MSRLLRRVSAALAIAVLLPPAARARVSFTGYGSLLATADSHIKVRAPASVLGSTGRP